MVHEEESKIFTDNLKVIFLKLSPTYIITNPKGLVLKDDFLHLVKKFHEKGHKGPLKTLKKFESFLKQVNIPLAGYQINGIKDGLEIVNLPDSSEWSYFSDIFPFIFQACWELFYKETSVFNKNLLEGLIINTYSNLLRRKEGTKLLENFQKNNFPKIEKNPGEK